MKPFTPVSMNFSVAFRVRGEASAQYRRKKDKERSQWRRQERQGKIGGNPLPPRHGGNPAGTLDIEGTEGGK